MVLFRHRSIRRDLILIIMGISLLSIVITSLSISLIHLYNYQEMLSRDIEISADVIVERARPLMEYEQLPNIKRRLFAELSSLLGNASISLTCLYDRDGKLLAFHDENDSELIEKANSPDLANEQFLAQAAVMLERYQDTCPSAPFSEETSPANSLVIQRIITAKNADAASIKSFPSSNALGLLYMRATLDLAYEHLGEQLLATVGVCLGALLICYLLAIKLQHAVSEPISQLSQATRNVVVYKDYSVRVQNPQNKYSEDISQLMDSFNAMLKDIGDRDSKLQRKNLELERAKEMAESANLSKSQFLANISHELRTPLNAIIGFSSIIINQLFGPLGNDKYANYAQDINEAGVHLLDVINDILDLSKAEAGKLSLRLEELDVHEALKKCLQIISERADEAEVAISLDIPANLPKLVADRVRFIQIMLNLLSNAVKFTEAGGRIEIQAEFEPAGNEVHYFTFRVKDTGIGMRKEDIDMAFQTFGQVDSGLNRRYEGTGLGLPLTKKLVELHNGSIRIDSALHQGTTVSIRLISDRELL